MRENLRRKWSFRINGQKHILIKRKEEKETHVLMKIFLAKLYAARYDDIKIEVRLGKEKRYKPDLIAVNYLSEPLFWGECGEVGIEKIRKLLSRYRETHFCFAKWNIPSHPFEKLLSQSLAAIGKKRNAPVDFINFSEEQREKIAENGEILINWEDVYCRRWS